MRNRYTRAYICRCWTKNTVANSEALFYIICSKTCILHRVATLKEKELEGGAEEREHHEQKIKIDVHMTSCIQPVQ